MISSFLAKISGGPAGGPKDFDYHVDFEDGFVYDPNKGHLLLDWRTTGGDGALASDWHRARSSVASSIFVTDLNADTAASINGPTPAQLTFVPEPSTSAVAAISLTALFVCFRRRSLLSHL